MKKIIGTFFSVMLLTQIVWAQIPTISDFNPKFSPVGTTVTITGTNFSPFLLANIVYFGAVRATVTTFTSTSLSATVPIGATFQPITVTTNGLTAYSSRPFIVTFAGGGAITSNSFSTKVDFTTGSGPINVGIGDVDGDGKPDLVVANQSSNTVSVFRNTGTSGSVSFATKVDFTTGSSPSSVAIGDVDGDGKPDLVVTNYSGNNTVSVFRNTGISGTISFAAKVDITTGSFPHSVAIGDVDGDGKPDLAVANSNGNTVSVFRNTSTIGNVSFAAKVDFSTGLWPYSVAIGDVDGDGKPDLAVTNGDKTVSVFRNTGTIGSVSFAAKMDFVTGYGPHSVAIGDVDGDGKPDLAVTSYQSNTVSVFRNMIGGNTAPVAPQNLTAAAGNSQVTLKWNKNTETDFLKYRVYMGTDSLTMALKDSTVGGVADTARTITGLTNGTKYYFRVSALDSARLESGQSIAASATPAGSIVLLGEYPTDASTVLLMHMNETSGPTVSDASGANRVGTIQSGVTFGSGRFGNAATFANQGYFSVAHDAALNLQDITIEMWLYPTNLSFPLTGPDPAFGLVAKRSSNVPQPYTACIGNDNTLSLSGHYGTEWNTGGAAAGLVNNQWQHVAFSRSFSGGQVTYVFHVNGKEIGRSTYTLSAATPNTNPVWIGKDPYFAAYTNQGTYQGKIDELRISNTVRGPFEFNLQLPPKNLTANASGATVSLGWLNGGGAVPLMRYKIYRGTDSTNVSLVDSTVGTSKANTVAGAGTYYYRISAIDSTGFEGAKSWAASATPETNAQIPNQGFETWESYSDPANSSQVYEKPDHWVGILPKSSSDHSFSIEKYSDSYPVGTGRYSMIITSNTITGADGAAFSFDEFPSGMTRPNFPPSFPINYRPVSLCLYYKYFPANGDTMGISCIFYRNGVVIGYPKYGSTQTVSSWTPLVIPMTYYNSATPDSVTIILSCFYQIPHNGSRLYVDNISFNTLITSVDKATSVDLPTDFVLRQNYPNPFNPTTTIRIGIPVTSQVSLKIFDIVGREVAIVVNGELTAGHYNYEWNAASMPSGMYFYCMTAASQNGERTESFTRVCKLLLIK